MNGCATFDIEKYTDKVYSPINPEDIQVLFIEPSEQYIKLAEFSGFGIVTSFDSAVMQKLKQKAASIGADAIILQYQGMQEVVPYREGGYIFSESTGTMTYQPSSEAMYTPEMIAIVVKFNSKSEAPEK